MRQFFCSHLFLFLLEVDFLNRKVYLFNKIKVQNLVVSLQAKLKIFFLGKGWHHFFSKYNFLFFIKIEKFD